MILFILVCLTSLVLVFYEDEEPYDEEIFIKKCI